MLAAIVVDRVRDAWTERRLAHTKRRMACSFNRQQKNEQKTYNSGYSLVVTHLTTNPPVRCLNRAERTGSLVVSRPLTTTTLKCTVSGNHGGDIR
jgi:hypothetical protein